MSKAASEGDGRKQMAAFSFIRKDFDQLPRYSPIQPLDALAKETGVAIENLAKLDANENLYGPVDEVAAALDVSFMHIYPDPEQTNLRRGLAEYIGCSPEQVLAGSGSDELIDVLIRIIDYGAPIVTAPPTFGMYSFLGKISGCRVIEVPRLDLPSFELDIDRMIQKIESENAKLVFVASPNNPTGGVVEEADVRRLCGTGALVVIDEAYAEFSGSSVVNLLNELPNLVVLRTFSKWAGLAGMRVGFCVAHCDLIRCMMAIKQPYNVGVAAEACALAALSARDKIRKNHIDKILAERARMLIMLQEFEALEPMPSKANFVLFRVNEPWSAKLVYSELRKLGVLIRYYPSGILSGYVRISAGRPRDTDLLIDALRRLNADGLLCQSPNKTICKPPKILLLDMDGVLAEVSKSFRKAIIHTANDFNVQVSDEDINLAKLAGNANDDWVLTHRLIENALGTDKAPSLQKVIERFQEYYLGSDTRPGLRSFETLIPSRDLLVELRRRCPLGIAIVTGRMRNEALYFLDSFNLRSLFCDGTGEPMMVCMHEAPSKPSPEPLWLALKRLGKHSKPEDAVFLGDTVDDMRSAVAAGVTGYGVLTPTSGDNMREALLSAGAKQVLMPGFVELLSIFSPRISMYSECLVPSAPLPRMEKVEKGLREAEVVRKTKETNIKVKVNLDGIGRSEIATGLGYLNHMIEAMTKHSRLNVSIACDGDLWIDDHHTCEDVGIALGEAVDKALGKRENIARWGYAACPLDEALSTAVVDISSRPWAVVDLGLKREMLGNVSTEMLNHFIVSFSTAARLTVHVKCISGANDHHRSESAFKALGVALRMSFKTDDSAGIPSTKGFLQ